MQKRALNVGLVLCLLMLSPHPGGARVAPPADVRAVFVTELPRGEREVVGVTAAGAHALRLSARGEVVS